MNVSLRSAALVALLGLLGAGCAASTDDLGESGDDPAEDELNGAVCAEQAKGSGDANDCHRRITDNVRGAYFRKVISADSAAHTGIRGEGVLPTILIDRSRWLSTPEGKRGASVKAQDVFTFGPLDAPSVYMGGRANEQEVDAGLSWNRVFLKDGRGTWTDNTVDGSDGDSAAHRFVVEPTGRVVDGNGTVRTQGLQGLVENFAFRPYWRVRVWANPSVSSDDNRYFYPGTAFRMNVRVIARDTLQMRIDRGVTDTKPFITTFDAPGYGRGLRQTWKRVNSVDQFRIVGGQRDGLEGSNVLPTATRVLGGRWTTVSTLGKGGAVRCAMGCGAVAVSGRDVAASYDRIFDLGGQTAEGAETIDIDP